MSVPFCSVCRIAVPDLETNHHVCVATGIAANGEPTFTVSTRDVAAAAHARSVIEGTTVAEAFAANLAGTPIVPL